ncbi:YiiX/YebB-like N1pC/P60 family cysteine hydrolase [Bacteroides sp. 51]|uniref:YiiX/YebB-like N1pC/P60 family cysteine hydrolase n=1 Tax=Bacteroides sp. 51 TaxID=2302938 RepID=UPI0013D1BE48|nr:YiiX/YebB-like N1pC/P60 family cysteine hydrolase [Bacteroides sp. 51]NDV82390.1 hypothetical protein [Bacteroides sp. 51]
MKVYILTLLLFLSANTFAQDFQLKNGDLIFQEACPRDSENPIKQVTSSVENYQFTHVGMVYIDNDNCIFVLEATTPKVTLTPLNEYLYPSKDADCYPISIVGRLRQTYQLLIPQALEIGITLIGKDYDYGFVLGNDKYYCSELVYEILKQANSGKEIFPLNVMTFKSQSTNETARGWVEHFNKHGLPIPEGEEGINPGAMSRCDVVEIVYCY